MKFNLNIIGRKKIWFTISGILTAIGLIYLAVMLASYITFARTGKQPAKESILGKARSVTRLHYGIEFSGGTLFDLKFKKEITTGKVRQALKGFKLENSVIQKLGKKEALIKTRNLSQKEQTEVEAALYQQFGKEKRQYVENVGPTWGRVVSTAAFYALLLSFAALLIYVSWRFEFKMAACALAALFHDILITIGIYGLVGREVTPNTVAALLTIMGYSLYDTIVVFHRVLENAPKMVKQTYSGMVNISINQVLVRSINTSITTLLPVLAVLFIGGATLKDFAFALFIGIVCGTYSSPLTASPLLALWKERESKYQSLAEKYGRIK